MKVIPRLIYATAVTVVALATLFGGGIIVFSLIVSQFVPWEGPRPKLAELVVTIGGAIVVLFVVLALVRRISWRLIGFSSLVPIFILTFLVVDEPRVATPDLGARIGKDDPDYCTIMWLAKNSPSSRLNEIPGIDNPAGDYEPRLPDDPARWLEYVSTHKALIETAWSEATLVRQWADRLADHPLHGVCSNSVGEPVLDSKAVFRLSYITNAYAYLLATEGKPDQAVDVLIPTIRAMDNIQQASPGLLHATIAAVVLKWKYIVLQAILDRYALSESKRIQLQDVLRKAPPIKLIFRNAFGGEIEFAASVMDQTRQSQCALYTGPFAEQHRWINTTAAFFGPFVFNRNRSLRLVSEPIRKMEAMAVARNVDAFDKWQSDWPGLPHQLRNPLGRLLCAMILPAYQKSLLGIWESEDRRLELVKRLDK